jgi:hypothetical protein
MAPSPKPSRNVARNAGAPYATRAAYASSRSLSKTDESDPYVSEEDETSPRKVPQLPKMREVCTPEQRKLLHEFFISTGGYPTKAQKAEISRRINKYVRFRRYMSLCEFASLRILGR